jgi:L-fucose mutarotase
MLKNIDPVLSPQLLHVLAAMGHGDEIVVADANFTAETLAAGKPVIRLPGVGLQRACEAVLSVLPLDADGGPPVGYMQVSGRPEGFVSAVQRGVIEWMAAHDIARRPQAQAIERFAFYDRVRSSARAIVVTGELQPFANFIFRKGVIAQALVA